VTNLKTNNEEIIQLTKSCKDNFKNLKYLINKTLKYLDEKNITNFT
jgi:hypothetical protein